MPSSLPLVVALAASAAMSVHAQTGAKPAAVKHQPKAAHGVAARPKAPSQPALPAATPAQNDAAARAYYGEYACEFNQTIQVVRHPKAEGYIDVKWNKKTFTMRPVLSSTGALRLEDVAGKTLVIQIADKSMLMDVVSGRRLVDNCVSADQRAAIERRAADDDKPGSGLGIDPAKAAAAAAAQAASAASAAQAASAASAAQAAPAASAP